MALINIMDLPQSDELDLRAKRSIAGGGRIDVPTMRPSVYNAPSGRIVDYPPGLQRGVSVQPKP